MTGLIDLKGAKWKNVNFASWHNYNLKIRKSAALECEYVNTKARRLRFHCCICSFGIGHEALSPPEFPSVPLMDSALVRSSSSNNIDEYLFSRGLHKPKSESFKWPFLSSIRLSGFMSLKAEKFLNQLHVGGWLWSDLYTVCTCKRTDNNKKL